MKILTCWILAYAFVLTLGYSANFTQGTATAKKYGVHEIAFTGTTAGNKFDAIGSVTFRSPSGVSKTVKMFHDGGDIWKARIYVNQSGAWTWTSSSTVTGLGGKSGGFSAVNGPANLRGLVRKSPNSGNHWVNDNGEYWPWIGDTCYYLFGGSPSYQNFVRDARAYGVTCIRAGLIGTLKKWTFSSFFVSGNPNLPRFQHNDQAFQWMLDNHPDMYVQFIVLTEFPGGAWADRSSAEKSRFLNHVVARYAAYPQILWQMTNDSPYSGADKSAADAVAGYLKANDPWQHPISTGQPRETGSPNPSWAGYRHFETIDALDAAEADATRSGGKPVFCGEDRYETYKAPADNRYFFRRLIWSWMLSGAYACYGGDWDAVQPYDSTSMVGLDSVRFIEPYIRARNINLSLFTPDDARALDQTGAIAYDKCQATRRGVDEFLVYHPLGNGAVTQLQRVNTTKTARFSLNLSGSSGSFAVEWLNAHTGATLSGGSVAGGGTVMLTAPWSASDVVCRLSKGGGVIQPPPEPTPDTQKPTIPSGFTATVQSSSAIQLNWTASTDNVGVVAYDVYRGTTKVGSTATTSFTNSGLTPSTAYAFKVQARDQAGNLSDFSAAVTATTSSGPVEPPPVSGGTVYQAEAAVVFGCVKYTSYVDYINNSGDYIEWTVNVPTAGNYALGFKYAFGSGNRPLEIKANGTVVAASLAFPGTGSTTNYQTVTTQASLSAGENKIRATAIGYSGGNMDALNVSSP